MTDRAVVVTVTTYRRTALLGALLAAVDDQLADLDGRVVRRIVVDNDATGSAGDVARFAGWEHVVEPRPGIGAARHRALSQGRGDLVVMLDDDLTPEAGWLSSLVAAWDAYRPTVVMGFVRYVWPEGTDAWLASGAFFRRVEHPAGTRLSALATGNVLIDSAETERRGVQFLTGLGLAGGEDGRFGADVLAAGGTIIGTSDSVAREEIPPERATRDFVRRRAVAHGELRTRDRLDDASRAARPLLRVGLLGAGAVRWTLFSGARLVAAVRGDRAADARWCRRSWVAQGRMRAAVGRLRAEYARS